MNQQSNQQPNIPQESQQPQPSPQPEIPQRQGLSAWVIVLIIVGAIVILAGVSYGVYWFFTSQPTESLPTDQEGITPGQLPTGEIDGETADWQTHRNEEYGFEVRHPDTWIAESIDRGIRLTDVYNFNETFNVNVSPLGINIEKTNFGFIQEWFDNEFSDRIPELIPEYDEIAINSIRGIKFSDPISMGGCGEKHVLIKNSKVYSIERYGETCDYSNELFDQILSTFKFIEVDEAADWQTYKNEEYGFEIKHPRDWELSSYAINNPSNKGYEFYIKNKKDDNNIITLGMTEKYPNSPDPNLNAPLSDKKIDNLEAQRQIFTEGYCDVLSCTPPFIVIWVTYKDYIYTFDFSNTTKIEGVYNQILSTFKFID